MEKFYPREKFLDSMGKQRSVSLFLEIEYQYDIALYSLKDVDHEVNGKIYPSIKRLYLEEADPTEYSFAMKYFLNWKHWKKVSESGTVAPHVKIWREELEQSLRSFAVQQMYKSAKEGNYQAAKWFADRSWSNRGAGRPSKAEIDSEKKFQAEMDKEYSEDSVRLFKIK